MAPCPFLCYLTPVQKETVMNFLNLQYFCVTAEELSFSKAAKRLFITQQSLSDHISRLEAEYGVELFRRTRPITLTPAGECLYRNSRAILLQKAQTEKILQDIRDARNAELSIGVSTSRGALLLADILPEFYKNHPQVKIHLVEGTSEQIATALREGRTDINLGFAMNDPGNVTDHLLYVERLACVVPLPLLPKKLRPLVEQSDGPYDVQEFKAFADCPFIQMYPDSMLGDLFETYCRNSGITPKIVLQTRSIVTMISLCFSGLGAILLPQAYARSQNVFWRNAADEKRVAVFPLAHEMGRITASHMKDRYLSQAATEFIDLAIKAYSL